MKEWFATQGDHDSWYQRDQCIGNEKNVEPKLIVDHLYSFPFHNVHETKNGKLVNIPKCVHEYEVTKCNQKWHGIWID